MQTQHNQALLRIYQNTLDLLRLLRMYLVQDKFRLDIINTQKSRRALHSAMKAGAGEHWDYDPPSDASQQYVRNHMDWTIAAKHYRFPPLRKK